LRRFTTRRGHTSASEDTHHNLISAQIGGQEKVHDKVDFPLDSLDMRDYVIGLQGAPDPVYYDLYAVSNHMGDLGGGHYTAYCKNSITD